MNVPVAGGEAFSLVAGGAFADGPQIDDLGHRNTRPVPESPELGDLVSNRVGRATAKPAVATDSTDPRHSKNADRNAANARHGWVI